MSNDSSTGGYLVPASCPAEDSNLDAIFQGYVAGITGLPGQMVRPRWQPSNPKQPEPTVDWCAIGVLDSESDDFPYIAHSSTEGIGSDTLYANEELKVLASFYGPNAKKNSELLRSGAKIPQNGEAIQAQGLNFIDCDRVTALPELFNQQWVRRYDLPIRFRRMVQLTYPIRDISGVNLELYVEEEVVRTIPIFVNQPDE